MAIDSAPCMPSEAPGSVALLGGSFCPVHKGHIMLADHVARSVEGVDQVWLVLSPRNPLKTAAAYTLDAQERLELLRIAAEGHPGLRVCGIELGLPVPSYTVDTLRALSERYPETRFRWLIGSDNLDTLARWKEPETILRDYGVLVYPRPGWPLDGRELPRGAEAIEAPTADISSTMIREGLERGMDISAYLPAGVWERLSRR